MPFLALIKLLNPKEWLIVAALVALAIGGIWLYRHGEQHIEAQDAKLAAFATKQVTAVEATAQTTESQSAIIYKQAVLIPAVGDIGDECVRKPSGSGSLPAAPSVAGATVGNAAADSSVGPSYDPSGAALTRAAQADAQIAYLQRRVAQLEKEMNGAP